MPFVNQPPGYQIAGAGKPVYANVYPPFNTNLYVIKGISVVAVQGSNAFGKSLRNKQHLQTNPVKTSF
jgi:hypothetical protein